MIFHVSNGSIKQSECWTHSSTCFNLTHTVGRFNAPMWVTPKTNRASFCLILKLSHALDGLFNVLYRLHGCKQKCTFCRMKDYWTWCDYFCFQILLLRILSSMEHTTLCCDGHFPGLSKYIFPQRRTCTVLVLSSDCTECSCSPNIVIF